MTTDLPETIGSYAVVARLDGGGESCVFDVRDGGGGLMAVKLYGAGEPEDLREFRRDALNKATSLEHPALIRYQEVGEHEGRVFVAMERFPSLPLTRSKLPLQRTLGVMRQIAVGLGYLHQQGTVHGCLNPARVLVSTNGDHAKLIEPGMSTETRPSAMAATATMQTAKMARYLAPELRRVSPSGPDSRSDIYAFGVLFYEALTGKVPEGKIRLPSQESDEVPPELDQVVLRCLRQDPAARYRSVEELVSAIDRVHGSMPVGLGRHFEALGAWRWAAIAALATVAVAALFAVRACA